MRYSNLSRPKWKITKLKELLEKDQIIKTNIIENSKMRSATSTMTRMKTKTTFSR